MCSCDADAPPSVAAEDCIMRWDDAANHLPAHYGQACSVFGDLFYAIRSCTQDDRRYVRFLRLSLRGEKLPDPPSQLRAFGVLR